MANISLQDVLSQLPAQSASAPATQGSGSNLSIDDVLPHLPAAPPPASQGVLGWIGDQIKKSQEGDQLSPTYIMDQLTKFNHGVEKIPLGIADIAARLTGTKAPINSAIDQVAQQHDQETAEANARSPNISGVFGGHPEGLGESVIPTIAALATGGAGLLQGAVAGGVSGASYDPNGNYASNIGRGAVVGGALGGATDIAGAVINKATGGSLQAIKNIPNNAFGDNISAINDTTDNLYKTAEDIATDGGNLLVKRNNLNALQDKLQTQATQGVAGAKAALGKVSEYIGDNSPINFNDYWNSYKQAGSDLAGSDGILTGYAKDIRDAISNDLANAAPYKPGLADAFQNANNYFKNTTLPARLVDDVMSKSGTNSNQIVSGLNKVIDKLSDNPQAQATVQNIANAATAGRNIDKTLNINLAAPTSALETIGRGSASYLKAQANPQIQSLLSMPVNSSAQKLAVTTAAAIKSAGAATLANKLREDSNGNR